VFGVGAVAGELPEETAFVTLFEEGDDFGAVWRVRC